MKKIVRLVNQNVKRELLAFIVNLPVSETNPLMVRITDEIRTLDQNALMWPLLECFATQRQWPVNGVMTDLSEDDWKDLLTAAFKQETQRLAQGINGGVVMLGLRTSKMTKPVFSEFIEFIYAAGAELGVVFDERKAA